MKKWIALLLTASMCLLLCACAQSDAAKGVDEQIKAIGDVTLDSEAQIIQAERALAMLTEENYKQVKQEKKLKAAREEYDRLVLENKISIVESSIDAIGEVTLDSQRMITAARKAYNEASEEVQAGVSNLSVLEAAEVRMKNLLIGEVEKAISDIGAVTLDSQYSITAAWNAYNSASNEVKDGVGNLDVLKAAEDRLYELRANEIEELIDAIGTVTLNSRYSINAARNAYDKAASKVQLCVKNLSVLREAETELQNMLVSEVERLIDDIGEVTIKSEGNIHAARSMYDSLSPAEKAKVSNASALAAAEQKFSEVELLDKIEKQDVRVISTKYVVQDDRYKSLYPDALRAVIQNDSQYDIKDLRIAYVAWDENKLPVKIKGDIDFSEGSYIKIAAGKDINLVPGATFGKSGGYEIDYKCGIKTFKAIVVSYETFDGYTWTNPYFDDWCKLYEGVKLK